MKFNARGLIEPPVIHKLSNEDFERLFVEDFPNSETRRLLFEELMMYTLRVQDEVTDSFVQWIGGSFTTRKKNPRDIDVLTILDGSAYDRKEKLLITELSKDSYFGKGVDPYFLAKRETNHKEYSFFVSDQIYWLNHFGITRKGRDGKSLLRGFIQLTYNEFQL
ncbi:MAG: hypothetical protein AAF741_09200 [Bacteroidota bacterium]